MTDALSTSRPQLLYLVFGAETYHQEAVFSIASALACLRETPAAKLDIQVLTDNPEPYRRLPVKIVPLDKTTRERWSEPHGYHFRTKHAALRERLSHAETALLIDTDTFFRRSPIALFERIRPGTLLCNELYGAYGANRENLLYTALADILRERQLADDAMPTLNSGVIGLHRNDIGILDRSLALMDEYFPLARGAFTLEEFCLSLAAYRKLQVEQCTDLIHHYWSRKLLFRAKVSAWLTKHGAHPTSAAALDDCRQVTDRLPRPPGQRRLLYKTFTLALPKEQRQFFRELLYGCYPYNNEFDRACGPVWWDKAQQNLNERLGHALPPTQLESWLGSAVARFLLGPHRKTINAHLRRTT